MADFRIQRGEAVLPADTSTLTITAGTDYTAPASATSAFIRLTSVYYSDGGQFEFQGAGQRNIIFITNPDNLLTSIEFWRSNGGGVALTVQWEIVEYIGAPGGANEFIVRDNSAPLVAVGTTDLTLDTDTVSGVVDNSKVVVFLTSVRTTDNSSARAARGMWTTEWVAGSSVGRATRTNTATTTIGVSMSVVEFTGSNWTVARYTHAYTNNATTETETITSVGSMSRAFIHAQQSASIDTPTGTTIRQDAYLSSPTELSFYVEDDAATVTGVVWVISNSDTGSGAMVVQRVNGTQASGGSVPDTWTTSVTAVNDLSNAGLGNISGQSVNNSYMNYGYFGARLTATDTLSFKRGRPNVSLNWRAEVVHWPGAAGGTTKTISARFADISGNDRASLSDLTWGWYDAVPATGVTPTDTGTAAATDASGNFSATLANTTLTNGQTGYLVIRSTANDWQAIHALTVVES